MKKWFSKHEWLRRALRTFFQAAVGVAVAAIAAASGVVEDVNWQATIVLAVSTGLAAIMNLPAKEIDEPELELDETEESDSNGDDQSEGD